ncbi:MAG: translation initiation factor eIF-1A [Nitrososphaerota archaeon]
MGKRKIVSEEELEEPIELGPGDVYGIVNKLLGFDRVIVDCSDGKQRVCRIRGQLKRRIWIKEGDLVAVSPWDFQRDSKGDIFWRFTKNQAIKIAKKGELPDFLRKKIEGIEGIE